MQFNLENEIKIIKSFDYELNISSLIHHYQKIIEPGALSSYLTLYFSSAKTINNLVILQNISLYDLQSYLHKLEAVKLVQTYFNNDKYIIELIAPILKINKSTTTFLKQILSLKLKSTFNNNISQTYFNVFGNSYNINIDEDYHCSPYEFIENITNKKVTSNLLVFITNIMEKFKINTTVMNVILERTWVKCLEFNHNYILKCASYFKINNIDTLVKAHNYLKFNEIEFSEEEKQQSIDLLELEINK